MKTSVLLSMVIAFTITSTAQDTEFVIHDNGLIYDEQTMLRLGHIVDSLNLRFKTCQPKSYHSLGQGPATVVIIENNTPGAMQAMKNGISMEDFLRRFPRAEHRKEWIVKFRYTDYRDKKILEYSSLPLRNENRFVLELADSRVNDKSNGWVFEENDENLIGVYLQSVQPMPITREYSEMIQYVDCMIDTTAQIYLAHKQAWTARELRADSKISWFLKFAEGYKGRPEFPDLDWDSPFAEERYEKYQREYRHWNDARLAWLDEKMKTDTYYKSLLVEAADQAIENGMGNGALELYVERYLSPALALKMKRMRRPVGNCSMDITPRLHAQNICRLAARTTQWDIFLRAHLDIMNDNFDRRSDGSYAWAGRGTYLKELEALGINAYELLIGTALRASDVTANHYFSDIGRIGRALSESASKDEVEQRILAMVEDNNLDLFNRLLMAYLFENYNHHLEDEARKTENAQRLRNALATLPDGIGTSFRK